LATSGKASRIECLASNDAPGASGTGLVLVYTLNLFKCNILLMLISLLRRLQFVCICCFPFVLLLLAR